MSYSQYYFALSLEGEVYQRLQQEKVFYVLLTKAHGNPDYDMLDSEPEDLEEEIGIWIEEYPDIFHTFEGTIEAIEQFQTDIRSYRLESASLASYEFREIESKLREASVSQPDAYSLIDKLVYGEPFDPHKIYRFEFSDLKFVSPEVVKAGMRLLQDIPPERIFDVPESWANSSGGLRWDDETATGFGYWRDLYVAAAERNEAVLIGKE